MLFQAIVAMSAIVSHTSGESAFITLKDVRIALAVSSFVKTNTSTLVINKVWNAGSDRHIEIASTSDEDVKMDTSRLSLFVNGMTFKITSQSPKRLSEVPLTDYALANRDNMFLQAMKEALKHRNYKRVCLSYFKFAGHNVNILDLDTLVFGNLGHYAKFDASFRLTEFKEGP